MSKAKAAAVIIEKWKLPIFSRHLREAGYFYDTAPGLTSDLLTLMVDYESVAPLKFVIEAAMRECNKEKK